MPSLVISDAYFDRFMQGMSAKRKEPSTQQTLGIRLNQIPPEERVEISLIHCTQKFKPTRSCFNPRTCT